MTPIENAEWTRRPDDVTTWRFSTSLHRASPEGEQYLATLVRRRSYPEGVVNAVLTMDDDLGPDWSSRTITVNASGSGAITVTWQRRWDTLDEALAWADAIVEAQS